jgi:hypothetical protein
LASSVCTTSSWLLRGAGTAGALDHPDFYLVIFGAEVERASYPGLVRAAEAAFGVLLEAIEAARSAGALQTKDARTLAGSLWSVVQGAASLDIGGDLHHARIKATSEDLVVEAIPALTAPDETPLERHGSHLPDRHWRAGLA